MSENPSLFKKCIYGFQPAEVISYIEALDAKVAQAKADADAKVAEAKAMLQSKSADSGKSAADAKEIERLQNELADKDAAIMAQVNALGELQKENAALKKELEDMRIKKTALEETSKQYDGMLAEVDTILARARREAEDLVTDAKRTADNIVEDAKASAKKQSDAIVAEADEMLGESLKKVRYLDQRKDELDALFRRHKESVDEFFKSVN